MTKRSIFRGIYKVCECGCKELMPMVDKKARLRRFKNGHTLSGVDHQSWINGRYFHHDYWYLKIPDYYRADKSGYVPEHVYFYEQYHKVCVCKWAVVHHIDENTENNMPWNLQEMARKDHQSLHHKGKLGKKKDKTGWFCSECKSKETYIDKKGFIRWHNDGKGGHMCTRCKDKIRWREGNA